MPLRILLHCQQRARPLAIGVSLVVLTLIAYARIVGNGFINLDDAAYITGNPQVQSGLSWPGVRWAFTTGHSANWHPLTWLSHMLDCQLWGLNPAGHHLTSVTLHATNAVLVFLFLERATESVWPSAFVAAVLALHPLHVESVAWAAERKDVLSGLLWILTMIAWVSWVKRPTAWRYAVVMVAYALGLMAKPMLVTLPLVLLLLDIWPLRRIGSAPFAMNRLLHVAAEKLPLFAMALASSVATYAVQHSAGAMELGTRYPLWFRLENALLSYVAYIGKALWPAGLAVFYPLPANAVPHERVLGAAVVLAGLSVLLLGQLRKRPYLAVGWLWYVGTLLPVIGIVQVGAQSMADRYTYIPLIGLSTLAAWGGVDIAHRWHRIKPALVIFAGIAVVGWIAATWRLVGCWKNDVELLSHEVQSLPRSHRAHVLLGDALLGTGQLDGALEEYTRAVEIDPDDAVARVNLARTLAQMGQKEAAAGQYREVLRRTPDSAVAQFMVAVFLDDQGDHEEAARCYREALRLEPGWAEAHNNYGSLLLQQGRREDAIAEFTRALKLSPDLAAAKHNLRRALNPK